MTETNRPKPHTVAASRVKMTELVLPNDTNILGNLLGGRLMHWIDIVGAMAAARHSHLVCVTASVDQLDFLSPVKLGEAVLLEAQVNRVFNTSLEVGVRVFKENLLSGQRLHANTAFLTFVGLNAEGNPSRMPQVIPETEEERLEYERALERRRIRLERRRKILEEKRT